MTLPYSTRLTMPLTISPMRSLNSSILPVALGLAHLLHDHLLGRLRGDAAEFDRRQRRRRWCRRPARPGCAARASSRLIWFDGVLDRLDHQHVARQPQLAGLGVDLGADVGLGCRSASAPPSGSRPPSRRSRSPRSIDFSRATASAICSSSSRLALTAIAQSPSCWAAVPACAGVARWNGSGRWDVAARFSRCWFGSSSRRRRFALPFARPACRAGAIRRSARR